MDRGGYRIAFGGDSLEDEGCKSKIGKLDKGVIFQKNMRPNRRAASMRMHLAGRKTTRVKKGCPGVAGIKTEPSSHRDGGIAHRYSVT